MLSLPLSRLRPDLRRHGVVVVVGAGLLTLVVLVTPLIVSLRADPAIGATWAGRTVTSATPEQGPESEQPPEPTPTPVSGERAGHGVLAPNVTVAFAGTYSWEMLDRRTGDRYGSVNSNRTNFSESMIKAWLAADFLNRAAARNSTPPQYRMEQLVVMIRDSHNGAAESIWIANGRDASIRRLIDVCDLADTRVYPDWWSQTMISSRDAVRMGECIANGTAAGPNWTAWLLNEMRNVRGTTRQPSGGRWGIIDALPTDEAATLAIKNGWTRHTDQTWNVNCLAVHEEWILAIMSEYGGGRGLDYGAGLCAAVTGQLLGTIGLNSAG